MHTTYWNNEPCLLMLLSMLCSQKGQTVLHIAARGSKEEHLQCLKELCSRLDSTNREDLITTLDKVCDAMPVSRAWDCGRIM